MMARSWTLEWSELEPEISIGNDDQLDRALGLVTQRLPPKWSTIVMLRSTEYTLTFALGSSESFVQLSRADDEPPYLATVGDPTAKGQATFYFLGEHHTEIPRRHLIPAVMARDVIREFVTTGRRSAAIPWEEI